MGSGYCELRVSKFGHVEHDEALTLGRAVAGLVAYFRVFL